MVDQGSEVNILPLSIYTQLISKTSTATRIRISLANHSYVYPLGIAEDVLVNVAGFLYPVDFMIIDDREGNYIPIIFGAPFLATVRATIRYETGIIELKSGPRRVHFHMTPFGMKNCMMRKKPPTNSNTSNNHVHETILAWEAKIKNYKDFEEKGGTSKSKGSEEAEVECSQRDRSLFGLMR